MDKNSKANNPTLQNLISFIKEQCPPGSVVVLDRKEGCSPEQFPMGLRGVVENVNDSGQLCVAWENEQHSLLLPGVDQFEVNPPLCELKLYMPLCVTYTDPDCEFLDEELEMSASEARSYLPEIRDRLETENKSIGHERGMMYYYNKSDGVDRKVHSFLFDVEDRNRQLLGVARCQVRGTLTLDELDTLKEYISGQASDGFGEGFEQREIRIGDGRELYVHFWDSSKAWSIQTEEALFGPKYTQNQQIY